MYGDGSVKMEDKDIIKYSLLSNTVALGGGGKGKKGYSNGKVRKERENNWKYIYFCKKYIEWFLFSISPSVLGTGKNQQDTWSSELIHPKLQCTNGVSKSISKFEMITLRLGLLWFECKRPFMG